MFNSSDVQIVKVMMTREVVSSFELHKAYRLSPMQLADSFDRLLREDVVVEESPGEIRRSPRFFVRLVELRWQIFGRPTKWKDVPSWARRRARPDVADKQLEK